MGLILIVFYFLVLQTTDGKICDCKVTDTSCEFGSNCKVSKGDDVEFKPDKDVEIIKVIFKGSELAVIPKKLFTSFPSLDELNITFSDVIEIEDETFSDAEELLDLNLENNNITNLQENVFKGAKKLKNIYLSDNHLKKINAAAFNGLKLKTLVIAENGITSFEGKFEHPDQIKSLDFHGNKLEMLDETVFGTLEQLATADFSNNELKIIKRNQFYGAKKLEKLYLSNNKITKLESLSFKLQYLQELYLINNDIRQLIFHQFRGESVSMLKILDLCNNTIRSLENHSTKGLHKLQVLNISQNHLEILSRDTFNNDLGNLMNLNISKNKIKWISPGTFDPLKMLEILDLSENRLKVLSSKVFEPLSEIQKLFLNNNTLFSISSKSFEPLKKLNELDLQGNYCINYYTNEPAVNAAELEKFLLNCTLNDVFCSRIEELQLKFDKIFRESTMRMNKFLNMVYQLT